MDGIRTKQEEREYLRKLIAEWNASRLDIFEISEPNEDLEYRGVMRFFFQDAGAKMATKCIRVTNVETADDVTRTLVEKFRPDMKMLSNPNYSLYEVHPNGESRKLKDEDRPLAVQLSWQENDREGRFLLKSDSEALITTNVFQNDENDPGQSFKRKLSKREKKEMKKKRAEEASKAKSRGPSSPTKTTDDSAIAQTLYNELPETSFTRSISNPEIVMKMRRQRKLERKLQEFQSGEAGAESGGTLKIFAETLKPEIPYKTLLVSMRDPTTRIVKEALEKYQMEKENPDDYCLVMVNIPPGGPNGSNTIGKERVVHDEDNPLAIAATWPKQQGHVVFHLRRRLNLLQHRKENKRKSGSPSKVCLDNAPEKSIGERLANSYPEHLLPYLKEVMSDGRELNRADVHRLPMEVTEVGSEKSMSSGGSYLEIFAPEVLPRHCVVTNMDGIVSVTPTTGDAEVYVDGKRIYESTKLHHGSMVKFGRLHTFKFGDPAFEETAKPIRSPASDVASVSSSGHSDDSQKKRDYRSSQERVNKNFSYEQNKMEITNNHESGMFETTFGVDGEIETHTNEKPPYERHDHPPQIIHTPPDSPDDGMGDKLPARLEFRESGEDAFFAAVISEVNGDRVHFKLAPTYTLYMCCRYRTSPAYREDLSRHQRSERLSYTVQKIANMVRSTVEENSQLPGSLAFWMANSSELLHFLKQDIDILPCLKDSHQVLAQSVQMAFRHLVQRVEQELRTLMSAFLDITEDADMEDSDGESMMDPDAPDHMMAGERSFRYGPSGRPIGGDSWLGGRRRHGKPTVSDILFTLSSAMSLLRRCRVNAALTIQVFSQLFHYINMWIFNKLVLQPQLGLCTRDWGHRLRRRLGRVESWAQKQGLELAADCHLCRVVQASHLLQTPKNSYSSINSMSSACYKLNSVQLRALLENYRPAPDELDISRDLIDSVVAVAENTTDELLRNQGQEVTLEEDPQLQLPFLLPEDRYSCEVIRGVPPGLREFLNPLAGIGLCRLTMQPSSSGFWTVYHMKNSDEGVDMTQRSPQTPEIMDVSFYKGQGGMGLSIVAAKGANQDKLGIYVKQVVKDGPAANDGRLQAGDQLLSVNGESLVGVPQERAAELMVKSGANVTLRIAKQGAIYHGLATLLSQPTPMVSREPQQKLVAVNNEDTVQASPTISEHEIQRSPGRWLGQQERDQSYNKWNNEDRERRYQDQWQIDEDRRRRGGDEERRRIEEQRRQADEERREEEERIRAEKERRYRVEEERRVENERRQAEEQRRAEEERRKLEEERRFEEQRRRVEEQRRLEEERRRAEEQRRLEDERRRAEEQRKLEEERQREEERRLEEQRLFAEEQRRIEEAREERRLAEEQRRLDEERRREEERRIDEQRRFGEERRRQEVERKRAEDALKMIGEQQRRQKPTVSRASPQAIQVEPVRSPYRVRYESDDRQRSPLTVKIEEPEVVPQNKTRVYAAPVSPGATSPRRGSPGEDKSPDEPPSSPIRIDSRDSRHGRYIMITQSQAAAGGAQPLRPGESEPDGKAREVQDNWKPSEKEEFSRWQRDEAKIAEERSKREERERREEEERVWRFHLEKQKREQEERERQDRERSEREKQEWERTRAERDRQERERLERERRNRERQELERIERDRVERERIERDRAEREHIERERLERERLERERVERERVERERVERERVERERLQRERDERERIEEEWIINQLQKEELDEQREREDHMKQLEEEQVQLRNMEQARLRGLSRDKGSKEYLDSIESLSADEVEREFQKRLEEEKKRKEAVGDEEERTAGGLVSVTRVKYHDPDKEERMERGRKIDLLLEETMRREKGKKESEKRRQQKDEEEERLRSERQQRRIQQFELDREQQKEAQRRIQEQREREQEEWLRQQREKRDQLRMEQEKQRLEMKMLEEEERNKKRQEIQQRRDQEERMRRESQKQKEEQERLLAEEQREAEMRRDFERRKHLEEQRIIKEKEEQLRKQQLEDQQLQEGRTRKLSTEDHVNELKNRATVDYERRRKLIDEEISRRRSEPVSVLKTGASRPKKQVSFSNVATEIREPASPSYVVGTPSGYTARVTPAPSVRFVNTRAPSDTVPDSTRPPLPDDDDDDDLPPPPPPLPPDELLEDGGFPPPPPIKSPQSFDRFAALSGDRSRSLGGYSSRMAFSSQGPRNTPDYPTAYSSSGVPLRQPPITSSSAYPSYVTLPRKPRPVSYPNAFEMDQQGPPPVRYGSQDNVLDAPQSRSLPPYAPKPARLDNDELNGSEIVRGHLARMSLTDEEKSENQFVSKKPENLHFKDKLKMFNKDTPEEKIRASRWQQEQLAQLNGDLTSP